MKNQATNIDFNDFFFPKTVQELYSEILWAD